MNQNRVVITGIGAVTPIGIGKKNYWDSLTHGISGIRPITFFDTSSFNSKVGGEIRDFDPRNFIPGKLVKRTDRSTHLIIAAAQLAFDDAQISLSPSIQTSAHVILGTAMSGQISYGKQLLVYHAEGSKKVSPFAAVSCFPDACSGQLSIFFKLQGPAQTICAGCSASTNAIIEAYRRIQYNETQIAIAGGTDAPLSEEIFCGFCQAHVLTKKLDLTPAPFDLNRDGTALSEGAGILILENLDHALKRNANIYAEIIGGASTTDAYQMAGAEPSGEQRVRAISLAMKAAGISPEEIDYINAHATATVNNDVNETVVIKQIFGERANRILINGTKSMIGHAQGAAGVLETIAVLLALQQGIIHKTINYKTKDPNCDLNYVTKDSVQKKINIALKNSFAFGGKNSVLLLKRFQYEF